MNEISPKDEPKSELMLLVERAAREGVTIEALVMRLVKTGELNWKLPTKKDIEALARLRAMTKGVLSSSVPILRELRD
jgi:hypothetical protein